MIRMRTAALPGSRTSVVGVGGAGCNVVSEVYGSAMAVNTIAVNTDRAALRSAHADCKVCIGGDGTQGDTLSGRDLALAGAEEIARSLAGTDVALIVAGFGGGTGTGAAPVIADICDRLGILTFTIVIDPFSFEGGRREVAEEGMRVLNSVCGNIFTVRNDSALGSMSGSTLDTVMGRINDSVCWLIREIAGRIPSAMADPLNDDGDRRGCGEPVGFSSISAWPVAIEQVI